MDAVILHIETATKTCSVALSASGKLLTSHETSPDNYIHGEQLTIFIEKVCAEVTLQLSDLDAVSVSIGPGSYTGLRIGLSTAKGLCFGLKIPIICIETLDSLLTIGKAKYPSANLCAMLDARRMEVYTKSINGSGETLRTLSSSVIEADTFIQDEPFIYFGDGAAKLKIIWRDRAAIFDSELMLSATGQVDMAYERYKNADFDSLEKCKPLYLKQFGSNT